MNMTAPSTTKSTLSTRLVQKAAPTIHGWTASIISPISTRHTPTTRNGETALPCLGG